MLMRQNLYGIKQFNSFGRNHRNLLQWAQEIVPFLFPLPVQIFLMKLPYATHKILKNAFT